MMQPSTSEYDMVPDADEDMEHVLCLVLNHSGNRLGVGGTRGFRLYALRNHDGPSAAGVDSPPYLELIVRYPSTATMSNPESSDEFLPELDNNSSSSSGTTSSSVRTVNTGVGAMALLGTTNIVAVCGGGTRPIGPQHQVLVFSAHAQQPFLNCTITLGGAVRKMIATPRFLAVLTVTELEIVSYTGERWYSWSAFGHPSSSSPLALHIDHRLIAFPVAVIGGPAQSGAGSNSAAADCGRHVHETTVASGVSNAGSSDVGCSYGAKIIQYPDELCFSAGLNIVEEFDKGACLTVAEAHQNPLAALCLNFDGTLLATSSERGTLIRLWSTRSGAKLLELRNTSTASTLGNLCFVGNLYLAGQCENRIKIFYVGEDDKEDARTQEIQFWRNRKELAALKKNQTSIFAPLGSVLSYFNSAWAATECELPSAMTPACLPIVRDRSQPNAATSVVSALQTTSNSFWGYLSTWVNSSSNPVGTSPSPLGASSAASTDGHREEAHPSLHRSGAGVGTSNTSIRKETYSLNTWEDLCVVWWEPPRMSTPVVTTDSESDQRRVRATDSFLCANCDGKVIKIQFDAVRGEISAGPPVPPSLPDSRSRR